MHVVQIIISAQDYQIMIPSQHYQMCQVILRSMYSCSCKFQHGQSVPNSLGRPPQSKTAQENLFRIFSEQIHASSRASRPRWDTSDTLAVKLASRLWSMIPLWSYLHSCKQRQWGCGSFRPLAVQIQKFCAQLSSIDMRLG